MQKTIDLFKGDENIVFLFINTLENKKGLVDIVKKYMDDHRYSFNVLFDVQDTANHRYPVIESYGAKGIPAKYVIDREGNIRFKLTGFSGSDEETVKELKAMVDMIY